MKILGKGDKILDGLYEIRKIAENGASLDYKAGGAALVYKAHHTKWNIDMAIKMPKEEILRSKHGLEDFQRECTTWMELGIHPNIAFCYYAREIDGCLAAFSEWEEGGTLMDAIKGPLYKNKSKDDVQKDILHIAIQTMRGLGYAHSKNVVHKDIKPENILAANGGIRINDFGLSNSLTNAPTIVFASPEQLKSRIGEWNVPIGSSTDIYSWALTVMTMYVGKVKWGDGISAGKDARGQLADSSCKLKAPETMIRLLCRCLEQEPGERPCAADLLPELTDIYEQTLGERYPHPTGHGGGAETAGLLNNRALSYIDMGKREEAEECWKKALTITPNHAESLYNMAISKDKICFDELLTLMKDNGIFPEDHREIFDEIRRASGLKCIKSFPVSTDRELKNVIFSDDGRYLMYRYNDDDTVYSLDTKTGIVDLCKRSVPFRNEKNDDGSNPMRAEYDMNGRTLILSEAHGSPFGQIRLEDRIDGKFRLLRIFEFTKAPFCIRPDGKAFALFFALPVVDEEQSEIQLFSVPEPYSCKHILSKVFHLNDALKNFKSVREMLEKAEAETERGNYREAVSLLNKVKNIPDFENQWERFYRLKQKIASKCRRSNPHFCKSVSIEPNEGVIACAFSPDNSKTALVLVGGTVEIREITAEDIPLILTIRPSDKFPMAGYLNYSLYIDAWFSKDGKYVAVSCWPDEGADETKTALIYDIENGMFNGAADYSEICGELCGKKNFPYKLSYSGRHNVQVFSGDGSMLVSFDYMGYDDRKVTLYYLDYDLEYIPGPEPANPRTDKICADDEINVAPNC